MLIELNNKKIHNHLFIYNLVSLMHNLTINLITLILLKLLNNNNNNNQVIINLFIYLFNLLILNILL